MVAINTAETEHVQMIKQMLQQPAIASSVSPANVAIDRARGAFLKSITAVDATLMSENAIPMGP